MKEAVVDGNLCRWIGGVWLAYLPEELTTIIGLERRRRQWMTETQAFFSFHKGEPEALHWQEDGENHSSPVFDGAMNAALDEAGGLR